MKGRIDLRKFIEQVKKELVEAQTIEKPFYELTNVELEVNFVLEAKGKAGLKFFVIDVGGQATAQQTHKVVLHLGGRFLPL